MPLHHDRGSWTPFIRLNEVNIIVRDDYCVKPAEGSALFSLSSAGQGQDNRHL